MQIRISDTAIPAGVSRIAEQLPAPSSVDAASSFDLRFPGEEFTYLTGLVLLATWRKALPSGVNVRVDDSQCTSSTQRFLTNTGFRELIDTGHETPSVQHRVGRIPLRPITNQFAKEATVNEIVSIFDEYSGQVSTTNPFKVLLSELCENVLAHSEFVAPAYVCARALDKSLKAEIAIADSGIGILNSYLRGTNEDVKERIKRGASPLELAIGGLNSSKPKAAPGVLRSYYGFGLLIARRLIEENRGQLFLLSGNEALRIDRYDRQLTKLAQPWAGTFIALVLDLANPLPLEEIYEDAVSKYAGPSPSPARSGKTPTPTPEPVRSKGTEEPPLSAKAEVQPAPSTSAQPVKTVELRHYGTELLTRDAGTAIRADLAGYLAAGYNVRVILDGVSDLTPSVADEAFAKLAEVLGHDLFESRVELVGGSSLAQRLIKFVLQTRRTRNT